MTEPPAHPEIRLERVGKSFGAKTVLDGIDLEIDRGELVAVVGGSGCGKSVLLELIIGLHPATAGRVLVADHGAPGEPLVDLAGLDEDALDQIRLHWSVVFQRNALYSGTVEENIALWLDQNTELTETEIDARVRLALDEVGFDGDPGIVSKRRDELSGGMAKRVAIARAIAMDPDIIFYDEPTTGLDPVLAGQIQSLIYDTHHAGTKGGQPRTSLVITHDKDLLVRLRPRVVMLHAGGVYFDGTYEDFAGSDSPVIRPYFQLMPVLQAMPDEGRFGST